MLERDSSLETRKTIVEHSEVRTSYVVHSEMLLIVPLLPESSSGCWKILNGQHRIFLIKQVLWSSGYDSRLGCYNIGCERSPVRVRARPYSFALSRCVVAIFLVLLCR
jgi:hypothetical protein